MSHTMRLKLKSLPNNNKGPMIVNVAYGEDDEGRGGKRFSEAVAIGGVIEVSEEIGSQILATYKGLFVPAKDKAATPTDEQHPNKRTKEIMKPDATA